MRILGFSQKWPKLQQDIFTTFRFPRKDKDWQVEEVMQVVYKPRSKDREYLGTARITRKEPKDLSKHWSYFASASNPNTPEMIDPVEAETDGFTGQHGGGNIKAMIDFFFETYGFRCYKEKMNKLTLYWIERAK